MLFHLDVWGEAALVADVRRVQAVATLDHILAHHRAPVSRTEAEDESRTTHEDEKKAGVERKTRTEKEKSRQQRCRELELRRITLRTW